MRKVCYMCFLMLLLASCRSSTKIVCGQLFDSYGDTIACCMLITEPLSDTCTVVCDGYFEIEVPRYADSLVFESCCFGKHTLPIHPDMYIQFDYLPGEDSYPYKDELIDHCTGNNIPWQRLGTTFEPLLRMAELCPSASEIHFGIFIPDEMLQVGD